MTFLHEPLHPNERGLDEHIAELVYSLNSHGIHTHGSCDGHGRISGGYITGSREEDIEKLKSLFLYKELYWKDCGFRLTRKTLKTTRLLSCGPKLIRNRQAFGWFLGSPSWKANEQLCLRLKEKNNGW